MSGGFVTWGSTLRIPVISRMRRPNRIEAAAASWPSKVVLTTVASHALTGSQSAADDEAIARLVGWGA